MNLDDIRGKASITAREAAKLLGVSLPTLYEGIRTKEIPSIRVSERRFVIPVPAFLQMLGEPCPHCQAEIDAARNTPE